MNLLCIDDDPDDFAFLQEAIRVYSPVCKCFHAPDGRQAVSMLETLKPEIIFLDNNMPGMNGFETLQQIRAIESMKTVPVYLLSTYIGPEDSELFIALGVADCIVKPDSYNQLCKMVKLILQKHHVREG